jgi:putative ABC transport system permease protein
MLGIFFGALILYIIDNLFGQGDDAALVNPTVNIPIILIAFAILIFLGTLIGMIPAFMATIIKPIEALREE